MSEPRSPGRATSSLARRSRLVPRSGGRTRGRANRRGLEPDALTCLLVAESSRYAEVYALKLELDGYHVVHCDCTDALESVRRVRPSLVFLDVREHPEEGVELHRRLRDDRLGASTPLILISELRTGALEEIGYRLGALDLVIKPAPQAIALSSAVSDDASPSTPSVRAYKLSVRMSTAGYESDVS